MYAVSLFVLREIFEIALIMSVVIAATRGLSGRLPYIGGGILAGLMGAGVIAAFTGTISSLADGMGQEIMNAAILLTAAAMIGWTAVWMRVHGRELSQKIKQTGSKINTGDSSMLILSFIIALAVFREGAEMVLFSYSAHIGGTSWIEIAEGVAIGTLGGIIIGTLFYLGMIKIFARNFLTITSTMLAFLAAGLAAKGVYYLAQVGLVPEFGYKIWDSSNIVENTSILGETLGVLIGYNATPSGIELMIYTATLLIIFAGLKSSQANMRKRDALLKAALPA